LERSYSKKIYGNRVKTAQLYEDAYSRYYYNAKSVLARPSPAQESGDARENRPWCWRNCSSVMAVAGLFLLVVVTIAGVSAARMV
jgi:hypothetical protein